MTEGLIAIRTWALELEVGKVEEEAGVEEKDGFVPLYKGGEYQMPPHGP